VAEQVGISDPSEVKRARAKYLAVKRAEWRLRQRLDTIDHEYEVIQPGLAALEQRITVLGELPEFSVLEEETPSGSRPNRKRS
jgi:hypothetical protein